MNRLTILGGKKAVVLGVLILLAGLGVFLHGLSGSSHGSINSPQFTTKKPAPVTYLKVSGKYLSFNYPSDFGVSPAEKPSGNELEVFSYIKRPSPFYFLTIVVSELPSGNLSDDGSYSSRLSQPDRYQKSSRLINGQLIYVFSDKTSVYAKAAWLAHGNKDVSVALSANAATASLDQTLSTVLQSITWR